MEVVGSIATIVQLASFSAEVLAIGYGYISRVKKAPLEIKTLMRELTSLNELLNQLEELATEDQTGSTKTALAVLEKSGTFNDCRCMVKVVEKSVKACQEIDGQHIRNVGRRMFWPFKDKETKETILHLGVLRDTLSAAVNVDSAKALSRLEALVQSVDHNGIKILEGITALQNGLTELKGVTGNIADDLMFLKESHEVKIKETERIEILSWLRIDGIDSDARYKEALSQRHGDTGSWILKTESFVQWSHDATACLWLYGIAGCGKTVLAATMVNYFQQRVSETGNHAVLYFFCDHRDPGKRTFHDLLCILVKQLLDDNGECGMPFRNQDLAKEKKISSSTVPKPLTDSDHVDLIQHLCTKWDSINLVIDAVDECADLSTFMSGVRSLVRNCNIDLILTSRHDIELVRAIEPIAKYKIPVEENMRDDIHCFLIDELNKRKMEGTLKLRDRSLEGVIAEELENKADGMILVAKLHLDYICRLRSDRAIKDALHKLPSDIYRTYDNILLQICTQHPDEIEDIERILQWLLYTMIPLTLEQVGEIISVRPGDTELDKSGIATDLLDLAASLGSLVTINTQQTVGKEYSDLRGPEITLIIFAHSSVEEYFKSGKMAPELAQRFCMDQEDIQQRLAKICAQYIGFNDFEHFIQGDMREDSFNAVQREHSRERADPILYPEPQSGNPPLFVGFDIEDSMASDIPIEFASYNPNSDSEDESLESPCTSVLLEPKETSHNIESLANQNLVSRGRRNTESPRSVPPSPPISPSIYAEQAVRILSFNEERAQLRERTSAFTFYDYACRYWADHLSKSALSKSLDTEASELLEWFLNPMQHLGNHISWQQMYHHDIVYYCPGRPPLHYAIEFKIESIVDLLRPVNEEVNELNCGVSALHVAARCGAHTTVEALLKAGAMVDLRTAKDPTGMTSVMTPLHFAAEGGHSNIIKLLLDYGASPHAKNESGATPFYRAARSGSLQALKVLYDAGSDINVQKQGFTSLFEAVAQCRPRIACQLLQWGADPAIVGRGGKSTLSLLQDVQNEPYLKQYWKTGGNREDATLQTTVVTRWVKQDEILKHIEHIRALNTLRGIGFMVLLKGLKRSWVVLKQMVKDTRPGTEREKDSRHPFDKSMIVTIAEFLDKDDDDLSSR